MFNLDDICIDRIVSFEFYNIICPKCNHNNSGYKAKFCSNCGQNLFIQKWTTPEYSKE